MYKRQVSTPCKEYAVIDGGSKTFPTDSLIQCPPYYYQGYAITPDNEDLRLERMNEEHGILVSQKGDTGLKVGDIIELLPIHICTAINLQNTVYILENGTLVQQQVEARGALT